MSEPLSTSIADEIWSTDGGYTQFCRGSVNNRNSENQYLKKIRSQFSPTQRTAGGCSPLKVTSGRVLAAGEIFTYTRLQIHKFNDWFSYTKWDTLTHIRNMFFFYIDIESNTVKDTLLTSSTMPDRIMIVRWLIGRHRVRGHDDLRLKRYLWSNTLTCTGIK